MSYQSYMSIVLVLVLKLSISCCFLSSAKEFPHKAVNLGNWLLTEGWMDPSRFDGIVNNDLLDGTQVQLKSTKFHKFLVAENGGGANVLAIRGSASDWETFRLWRVSDNSFNFRVFNKKFIGIGDENKIIATSNSPGIPETFTIVRKSDDPSKIRIQASNGLFLQVKSETIVSADYEVSSSWEESDPSVFEIVIVSTLQGEYQITNGYGPDRAPKVMQDHWNTFITEEDFRFMSENGLTAVRIPVGWWIAHDPSPPKPFVGGALASLDNAFTWAQKHGMKVIVCLHAVQGSQNGHDHSAPRDGHVEWGDSQIPDTVAVIDFLAARYSNRSSLGGIELMNEPLIASLDNTNTYFQEAYGSLRKHYHRKLGYAFMPETTTFSDLLAEIKSKLLGVLFRNRVVGEESNGIEEMYKDPGVKLDSLKRYYEEAYNAVRKHSETAYVIMSNPLMEHDTNPLLSRVLISFAARFKRVVIDIHYYNLYYDTYKNMNVQQNIDYILNQRASDLGGITAGNGPLIFVGEWTAEWNVKGASKEEYERYAEVQEKVYSRATFGYGYWSYKCTQKHWSLKWNIENGYIKPFNSLPTENR